ncbi:cupin domain-containing protein [Duganella sp. FT135W]|uniref:Cupin domain-containing protein n=1 Tax=Duganella flavida TaxID=2692175 RepID=A0A6L8KJY9_9BURK|nr:cupin domain-containing protein [Duganella flavida]MYM24851.1 cupin domain-containing protein [Duganella flavida]
MKFLPTPIAAALLAAIFSHASAADVGRKVLMSESFEPRALGRLDIGDFHFVPGQLAPLHTHAAPAFGYVSKGQIVYQVAGREPQLLKEGDVFYEPVGPEIVHFDNASSTEEAIFTDLNVLRKGDPFIVFSKPLTEKIDRRTFPSELVDGRTVNHMDVIELTLDAGARLSPPASSDVVTMYVAKGTASVEVKGEAPVLYSAGQTFFAPKPAAGSAVTNGSGSERVILLAFELKNKAR